MKKGLRRFLSTLVFIFTIFVSSCQNQSERSVRRAENNFPKIILWAWERPENLEFIDSDKYGVAFLAQTLVLENDQVIFRPRLQPLKVSPQTKLIAVTRIESSKITGKAVSLSGVQKEKLTELILKTLSMKNVSAIQIDFDATLSEREFYRGLIESVSGKLPPNVPFSITALASFCLGDRWFAGLPVDEAVPMIFRMGADDQKIKKYLANGSDFTEPSCRKSYGIAIDEPVSIKFEDSRRVYIFNNRAWETGDIPKIEALGIN